MGDGATVMARVGVTDVGGMVRAGVIDGGAAIMVQAGAGAVGAGAIGTLTPAVVGIEWNLEGPRVRPFFQRRSAYASHNVTPKFSVSP